MNSNNKSSEKFMKIYILYPVSVLYIFISTIITAVLFSGCVHSQSSATPVKSSSDREKKQIISMETRDNHEEFIDSHLTARLKNIGKKRGYEIKLSLYNGNFSAASAGWSIKPPWFINSMEGWNRSPCAEFVHKRGDKNKRPSLSRKIHVQPQTYYMLLFKAKGTNKTDCLSVCITCGTGKNIFHYRSRFTLTPCWNTLCCYFFSGNSDYIKISFYPKNMRYTHIFIDEIEIRRTINGIPFSTNTVPNYNFEKGFLFWTKPRKLGGSITKGNVFLDYSTGCLDGNCSVCIDTRNVKDKREAKCGIISNYLPAVPGKRHLISFWAKSDTKDVPLTIIADSWSYPKIPPHWYLTKVKMLTTEWRKYFIGFRLPAEKEFPMLKRRVLRLKFYLIKKKNAIWIDNIEFYSFTD